jgi:hypothetical protein
MKPLPIAAVALVTLEASEAPRSLREDLRTVCPNAPRRLNRLIELALIGAHRCAAGRALDPRTAIYMACTHGCIADAVTLVSDVVRGQPAMPVTFINVSSNMAGFYVASTLGLHSGNHVGSANEFAWEATLALACASHGPVLLGAVEECAWPLDAHRVRLDLPRGASVLETSQWLLADPAATAPIAWLEAVRHFPDTPALLAHLRANPPRAPVRVQVSGPSDAGALAEIATTAGLAVHTASAPAGQTGMPAALHCLEFIEAGEPGTLLHLSAAQSGAWYLVALRRA